MLASEKLAIAAHLHVLLRRKAGRVTDTEWMAINADYAAEMVRVARSAAQEGAHADLAEWADKLEQAWNPRPAAAVSAREQALARVGLRAATPASPPDPEAPRYIGGLR
ncbi:MULTISPECIES: hypothetical protein [Curvibacter]|uniref:hypothetical protein n=1 Tax=Curvibacter TaxID=281915 RepID=UPI000374C0AC|nr:MULTISPECIES: hypothetical protein [Curvibacter]MBV5294120.1 hypothetical protein [Curvibacter lanceolatus]